MKTSKLGLKLIMDSEGLRTTAYQDGGGVWTIGYGTTHYEDGSPVKKGDRIDIFRAASLLRHDVSRIELEISGMVEVPLNQCQFDALVDFSYNLGCNALRKSSLLKFLNAGDYIHAGSEFGKWVYDDHVKVAGLISRRQKEKTMFLS
jgi:lysozyme